MDDRTLKLFHVVRGAVIEHDTYSDFVCSAYDAEQARRMYPDPDVTWDEVGGCWRLHGRPEAWTSYEWDTSIDSLTVTEIGTATADIGGPRVIIASFHAG